MEVVELNVAHNNVPSIIDVSVLGGMLGTVLLEGPGV